MGVKPGEFGSKQLATALGSAILYAAISIIFDPELSEYISADGIFENLRPAIFFPAVVAVLYGPIVGAISAGLGNLLFDITKNVVIEPYEPLEFKHLIGFLANLIGGYVAGLLSKPAADASTLFEVEGDSIEGVGDYFNLAYVRRLIRNTIASIIGLGFVTGLIIGYGQRLEPLFYGTPFDNEQSFNIFSSIAYSNGLVMIVGIPIVIIAFSIIDYQLDRKAAAELKERRSITIENQPHQDFEIVEAKSPIGDELWNLSWGAIQFVIKNISETAKTFVVRVSSNDIFSPHRHQTPRLQPGESDEMYFNVYGISDGPKKAIVYVMDDETHQEQELQFSYEMGSSSDIIINKLMGIFLVVGLIISAMLVIANIGQTFVLTTATVLVLLALPIELVIILVFYWLWNLRVTDSVLKTVKLRSTGEQQESTLVANIEETDFKDRESKIGSLRLRSRIFLALGALIFLVATALVIARINEIYVFANDIIIGVILLLIVILLISDYYLEQSDDIQETILSQKQLEQKVIRKAVSERAPEQFTTTKLTLRVNNPFPTTGMRIYIHSIDNISPREFQLEDMKPDEVREIELDFTALDNGERDVGFEFVQYRNEHGEVVIPPAAKTFDQESLRLKVTGTRVLGLSPGQIGLLRKLVAAIGAITLSISFLANLLRVQIDQHTIETTIPLLVILQAPVIWLVLFMQNKFQKSLASED